MTKSRRTVLVVVCALLLTRTATPDSIAPVRLWVVQAPDQIVEYDIATSAVVHTQTVPRRLIEHPEFLNINAAGQMLFLPPHGGQWPSGEMATAADRAWFWDGHQAREWKLDGPNTSGTRAGTPTAIETTRQWLLSADGESLIWIEDTFETMAAASGTERSVHSTTRVSRTALDGGNRVVLAAMAEPGWCECTTGVCSESCPERSVWAPNGVVADFFLVTRMTPGQLASTYHDSVLYQRTVSTWVPKRLAWPIEVPLDASEAGATLIAAVPDGGCCGWENESSDQLLLLKGGGKTVLYDEARRFDNRNYDVSFYASDARLSAGNAFIAYTLASTAHARDRIRLSDSGRDNAGELARVRGMVAELPAVEIVPLGRVSPPAVIRRAGLVGWMDERSVLVAQNGHLAIYDVRGTKQHDTAIRVRTAADAFER
jgi:hypothetical protein